MEGPFIVEVVEPCRGSFGVYFPRTDWDARISDCTGSWLQVAPPEARWFLPMPEPAGGPLPDPLF
jgi:hypothetical protein